MHDFYRSKKEPNERMATLPGAGLPSHVDPNDWELIPSAAPEIYAVDAADIEEAGFFYFKLVEGRPPRRRRVSGDFVVRKALATKVEINRGRAIAARPLDSANCGAWFRPLSLPPAG